MAGLGSAVLESVNGGSALDALGKVSLAICALIFGLVYRRYVGILGANRRVAAERQAYDALRDSLAEGNIAARLYARRLTGFLDWIDRFFGDAGMPDRTLFPHAFWLRTPVPLWTAPAFDRCLLLALIYPIVTIVVIWAISAHVGPAEAALQLAPNMPGWRRGLLVVLLAVTIAAAMRGFRTTGWKQLLWVFVVLVIGGAGAGAGASIAAFGFAAVAAAVAGYAVTGASALTTAVTMAVAGSLAASAASPFAVAVGVAVIGGAIGAVSVVSTTAITRGWQGPFLSFFIGTMIAACLMGARLLPPVGSWDDAGPLLLFLGLLTLLNAPFDWASLGLTRALLRRGLELSAWWPYALALVDACLAAVIIAVLALTMIVGVQAFDALAVRGGGTAVLPLDPLFTGIAAHPTAPGTGGSTRSCSRP
jgi:hypothetical protein